MGPLEQLELLVELLRVEQLELEHVEKVVTLEQMSKGTVIGDQAAMHAEAVAIGALEQLQTELLVELLPVM
ncbi:hypothetical protein NL676_024281 [Syzygium grande]|nr:hypothetical protein NL676_024281 [Syzygium grande]